MKTTSHLEKIERLCRFRHRLEPLQDFELWYWTTLTASTNALNACYHLCGLTPADPVFSTIPGVHVVQQPDGSYARALRGPGDVSHLHWPVIDGFKPEALKALEHAIESIESHRDPCLRGDRHPSREIVNEVESSFQTVQRMLGAVVLGGHHEA